MIVDCHAHAFQNWQGPCGHPSAAIHLKYLQKVVTRPVRKYCSFLTAAEKDLILDDNIAALFGLKH